MEFWSIKRPTETLTYTLTISAPVLPEEWLVPLEHYPLSPKDDKEQIENLGQIITTVDKEATKSPWDVILTYTAPKLTSASFETWSKRAQVRRARKSNGKAESGVGGVGVVGTKAGGGGEVAVVGGGSGSMQMEGGVSELYRILQPKANGLTSTKPLNQAIASSSSTVTSRLSSQTVTLRSAESTITVQQKFADSAIPGKSAHSALQTPATTKTTESTNPIITAVSQTPFLITGSSTSATTTCTWNGSISPSGTEITSTTTAESNRSTPQAVSGSLNGPVQGSQVFSTTQSHQPVLSTPQVIASIVRMGSMRQTLMNGPTGMPLTTTSALSSRPIPSVPCINNPGALHSENSVSDSGMSILTTRPSESISTAPHTTTTATQANTGLNQISQASCNTSSSQAIPGAPLISTITGSSVSPTGGNLSSSQASTPEKIPKVSHIIPTAEPNGALSQSLVEEMITPAIFRSFIAPQVHTVKGDAVTATLMFANDDSALPNSNSYEVDIVRVQNDPLSVTKETKGVAMETNLDNEEAITSSKQEEKSSAEDLTLTKKGSEISVGEKESDSAEEARTVNEGEGQVGGVNVAQVIEKVVANISNFSKQLKGEALSRDRKEDDTNRTQSDSTGSTEGKKTTPTSSKTTPTPTSPKPTTPTSTMSFANTNSIASFLPSNKAKSPPTSAQSPPTSPAIAVFQNMTYVPYISNNHLYLYPVSPNSLMGHTPSQQSPSHLQLLTTPPGVNLPQSPQQRNEFPGQKAANRVKVPRRRRKPPKSPPTRPHPLVAAPASQASTASPASPASPITRHESSEDAVAKSLCLRRKGEGLPVDPFTLTYTVTSSAGHSWTTNSLEGEENTV